MEVLLSYMIGKSSQTFEEGDGVFYYFYRISESNLFHNGDQFKYSFSIHLNKPLWSRLCVCKFERIFFS